MELSADWPCAVTRSFKQNCNIFKHLLAVEEKGGVGRLNAAIALSCQNSFRAPAAKLVYKLTH